MPDYYVSQGGGAIGAGTYRGVWVASQTYVSGDRVVPTRTYATAAAKFYIYECTTGGTAGGSEPTWVYASPGTSTTTDNTVTWTCRACTTWANANIYLSSMAANDAAGDTFYVKNDLNESYAGAISMTWAGTLASPVRIICVSDSNEPPTTVATGAIVETTGANNLTAAGTTGQSFFDGITFKAGDSTNAADISLGGNDAARVVYSNCAFELNGNNSGSDFTGTGLVELRNCTLKTSNAGSSMSMSSTFLMIGGSISAAGTPPNPLYSNASAAQVATFVGVDLSNLSSSANLAANGVANQIVKWINCKLPASWSGSVNSSTPGSMAVHQLMNSDSADTNYRLEHKTQFGTVTHETTLIRTGGASDGTTGISWKMVSNADSEWSHQTLDTPEIVQWVDSTGSKTATIEILRDSATNLTNKEIWVEVMYLGTSGVPLGSTVSDAAATYLTAAADQADSSATWTTTGMSNPNTQKLNVTFTVNEKGFIHAVVKLAKASTTVYVCPKIDLT